MRGRRGLATGEVAWLRFRSQENEQVAEAADCESPGSRQWAGLAVCRPCHEGVVAVVPSAIAEQLAGSLGHRPERAFEVPECALREVQLCSRSGLEHPVGIVHCLSDSSPSELGCGTAANPAELMSEGA